MLKNKKRQMSSLLTIILLIIISSHSIGDLVDEDSSKVLLSPDIALNENPIIAVFSENIHVVWNIYPDEYTSYICYRGSHDNGKTWENKIKLNSNSSKAVYPDIAVNENIVHVAWSDYRNGNPEIYYIRSNDSGENWSIEQRLTFNNSRKNNIYDIGVEADGLNVYIVWKDYRSGSSEIFFKKSSDNGITWSEDIRLTTDFHPSYYPDVLAQDSMIYVVFEDRDTHYNLALLTSKDQGNTWSEKKLLKDTEVSSERPDIAVFDNSIFITWEEHTSDNREIFFIKSLDDGKTWTDAKKLSSNDNLKLIPKIYAYRNNITIIWHEIHNNTFSIICKTSKDGGDTWGGNIYLISDMDCYNSEITGEGDNQYLVFQNYKQAAWAEIWFMGTFEYNPIINQPSDELNDNKVSRFEFTYLIVVLLVIFLFLLFGIYIFNKKRRRYLE